MTVVIATHGVTDKTSLEQAGFAGPLFHNMREWLKAVRSPLAHELRFAESIWADEMDVNLGIGIEHALDVPWYLKIASQVEARFYREIVTAALREPVLIVAHSLGSVRAVGALSGLVGSEGLNPISLLTLGSPLGVDVPFLGGDAFLNYSRIVGNAASSGVWWPLEWRNIFHPDDLVTSGLGGISGPVLGRWELEYCKWGVQDICLPDREGGLLGAHEYINRESVAAIACEMASWLHSGERG